MTQRTREETIRAARLALAETLQKARAELARHGDAPSNIVSYAVENVTEAIDFEIRRLRFGEEVDEDIDDAIDDIGR